MISTEVDKWQNWIRALKKKAQDKVRQKLISVYAFPILSIWVISYRRFKDYFLFVVLVRMINWQSNERQEIEVPILFDIKKNKFLEPSVFNYGRQEFLLESEALRSLFVKVPLPMAPLNIFSPLAPQIRKIFY